MNVSEEILALQLKSRLTQQEFAEKCGLHRSQITKIIRGEHSPSIRVLEQILSAFGKRLIIK